jgi:hypothetical protein
MQYMHMIVSDVILQYDAMIHCVTYGVFQSKIEKQAGKALRCSAARRSCELQFVVRLNLGPVAWTRFFLSNKKLTLHVQL